MSEDGDTSVAVPLVAGIPPGHDGTLQDSHAQSAGAYNGKVTGLVTGPPMCRPVCCSLQHS